MRSLRTPDERFTALPGYDFAPHYVDVAAADDAAADDATDGPTPSLRMHYVDEGARDAPPVLLLHGEPSWSYLYRKMIPILTGAGLRAIAPDLIGFGRSDKPTERSDYTYARHVGWMAHFVEALDLGDVTLVCQDWGGLIGLRLVAEHAQRFGRVVAANTSLPTGDRQPPAEFFAWQKFSQETPTFSAGRIVAGACQTRLSPEVIAAYDAPFPDESYKAGARQFPLLVPTRPDDPAAAANRAAWDALARWQKPFVTAFSDLDPITRGGERALQKKIPGAANQPHVTITGAGHFLQEDRAAELAAVVTSLVARDR